MFRKRLVAALLLPLVASGCIAVNKRTAEVVVSRVSIEDPTWAAYDIIEIELTNLGDATAEIVTLDVTYYDEAMNRIAESNHDGEIEFITPGSKREVWSTWVDARYVKVNIWYDDVGNYDMKEYSATLPVPYQR